MAKFNVRDKRDKGWFYMDNEYLNGFGKRMGAIGIAVYVSLCRHADNNTQKCFPSQKLIAKEIGSSPRTVRRYLTRLEEHNIIKKVKERTKGGKWLNNAYYLLNKSVWVQEKNELDRENHRTESPMDSHRTNEAQPEDTRDTTIGQLAPINYTNTNKTNTNYTKKAVKEKINTRDFINLFKEVNPSYKQLFVRKVEHSAMNRMIAEHGADQMRKVISLLVKSNAMPYAPSITSPYELEMKFGKLKAFWQKEANKINENNSIIL